MEKKDSEKRITRRDFIGGITAAAAAFTILPGGLVAGENTRPGRKLSPSDRLNIAVVGVGGMGRSNLKAVADTENIAALCDVDENLASEVFAQFPKAARFWDFRDMLDKAHQDIDAVIVATPDHTHAVVAMAAMQMNKHVYVQKPLTRLISEARKLAEAARRYDVKAQMGNQHHSEEPIRLIAEMMADGAIGPVREVHLWTNRPVWLQGVAERPAAVPRPDGLDWDLWCGPSPLRDYNPVYHPFAWRGWWDFGTGALGDMGCHFIDPTYFALKLTKPTAMEASIAALVDPKEIWEKVDNRETFPSGSIVTFEFPARETMPPVRLFWYDGGLKPPRPEELEPGRNLPVNGSLYIGERGKILHDLDGAAPRIIPEEKMRAYTMPAKTIPRITTSHEMNWVNACKGVGGLSSPFDYAGPLAESTLAGNLAVRFPWQRLEWDAEAMRVTNFDDANEYVEPRYREGYSL